jgi:ABC-2 type transport system permease protein
VDILPPALVDLAHATPSYWYAQLGRDVVAGGAPSAVGVLVLVAATALFSVAAVGVARRRPLHAVAG